MNTQELPAELRAAAAPTLATLRDEPALAAAWESAGFAPALARVAALSPFASRLLTARPEALAELWQAGLLARADTEGELAERAGAACREARDDAALKAALRRLRAREILRIVWRELTGAATLDETLETLSALADACLGMALAHAESTARARHGTPRDAQGRELSLVVLALGKLGGRELNFSSDIDLVYAYAAPGRSDGARPLEAQEFFTGVARTLTQLLDEPTADGRVFRVDLRLRPFGSAGPLVADFDTLERYYQEHGRDWERYALVKARPAAGDLAAGERLLEQLRPFVYRRYVDFGVIDALREMKAGIEAQVRRGGLEHDLKLGPGGIREVEFIGQVHQLIRGGRESALRERPIRQVLRTLARLELIPAEQEAELQAAYAFLRRAENAIQMLHDRQTQALPEEPADRLRLAVALGFGADVDSLLEVLAEHRRRTHAHFTALLGPAREAPAGAAWEAEPDDANAAAALAGLGFPDGAATLRALAELRESRAYRSASATARRRLAALLPLALEVIGAAADPPAVLGRFLALIEQVCQRSAYVALLAENPGALDLLVRLMAASPFLARWLTRYPVLLDELLDPRTLYDPPDAAALQALVRARLTPAVRTDLERAMEVLRELHHAQVLRIAAAELAGHVPAAHHLTVLAEQLLGAALELADVELAARHGAAPGRTLVLGYGRLGSAEMGYSSDLDLVFLHDAPAGAMTAGARPLPAETYYARLAQRTVHILAANTPGGRVYQVDLRLRPSGQSGPLVSTLAAFADYQHEQAWTWEHQALVRARPVAGDAALAEAFESLRAQVLARARDGARLRAEVVDMRARWRAARGEGEGDGLHLKQGAGGLVDLEFIAQYLVLAHAHACPALIQPRACADILRAAEGAGVIERGLAEALGAAYQALSQAERRLALTEVDPVSTDPAMARHAERVAAAWAALFTRHG